MTARDETAQANFRFFLPNQQAHCSSNGLVGRTQTVKRSQPQKFVCPSASNHGQGAVKAGEGR
jgi:hypothetical protein